MKHGKVWGETRPVLITPGLEVHELTVFPNSFCSTHKHAAKCNAFYCVRGRIRIEARSTPGLVDETILAPGDMTTIMPGVSHRFITGSEEATVLEWYYLAPLDGRDIEREDVGGRGVVRALMEKIRG